MAKCFKVVGQGIPVRMSDADAFQVVERDHDGEYCPKHVWKEWACPDSGLRKLEHGKLVETGSLHVNAQRGRRRA